MSHTHSQSHRQYVALALLQEILSSLRRFPCAWRALSVASAIIIRLTAWQDKVQAKTALVQFLCNEQCATPRCLEHMWCIAPGSAMMYMVHGHKNNHDENGKWIIAALVPTASDYCRSIGLQLYFSKRHGGGKMSLRTERLGMD